jgi:hypothetical protein
MSSLVHQLIRRRFSAFAFLLRAALQLPRPSRYSVLLGSALDFTRSYAQLVAENALLRQQLIILHRQVGKPRLWREPTVAWKWAAHWAYVRQG